jgi:hypothetical protein
MGTTMPTCPNGHTAAESAAFCHECGALVPRPRPVPTNLYRYASIVSLVVIVLGTLAIVWVLGDHGTSRDAAETDASVAVCSLTRSQRPTTLTLGCGAVPGSLTDVTWSQWGGQSATGTGTYVYAGRAVPATIELTGVKSTPKGPLFTRLTVTPTGAQPMSQALSDEINASGATNASARVPLGGALCPRSATTARLGVVGRHTSCDFAAQVRRSYLAAGGHGQDLTVSARSTITHKKYKDIRCSAGTYVVCVGGEDNTATVFFGPFD